MKTAALVALWMAIVMEGVWLTLKAAHEREHLNSLLYPLIVTLAFSALAVTRGHIRWLASILRIFIGVAFLGAICDRLGFLGRPGTPGVAWGNFKVFIGYTGRVNSFLPQSLIPALAVIESLIEALLGICMVLGAVIRITVRASAVLLFILGTAMSISLGFSPQFPFAVFVLAAGAWVLSCVDPAFLSVDSLVERRNNA